MLFMFKLNRNLIIFFLMFFLIISMSNFFYSYEIYNQNKLQEYKNLEIDFIELNELFDFPEFAQIIITPNNLENSTLIPFLDDYVFNDTDLEFKIDGSVLTGQLDYNLKDVYLSKDLEKSTNKRNISRECISLLEYLRLNKILTKDDLILRTENRLIENGFSKDCIDELVEKNYLFPKNILLELFYRENSFKKEDGVTVNLRSEFLDSHLFSKGHNPIKINLIFKDYKFINFNLYFEFNEDYSVENKDVPDYSFYKLYNKTHNSELKFSDVLYTINIPVGVLDVFSEGDYFITDYILKLDVYRVYDGYYNYILNPESQDLINLISLNKNLYLILNKNYLVKDYSDYIGISEKHGFLIENNLNEYIYFLESSEIVVFEDNIINTLEKIITENDLDFTSINFILQKILEEVSSIKSDKSYDEVLEFFYNNSNKKYKDLDAYNYVLRFIDDNFIGFEKEVLRATFILHNFDYIKNYHLINNLDDRDFTNDTILDLKETLFRESNENFSLDYYTRYTTVTDLDNYFYNSFKETEYDPDYLKQIYFNFFESVFLFGLLVNQNNFIFQENPDLNNIDFVEKSFKALIHLEDTEVNLDRINDRLEDAHLSDELVYTLRNPHNFSTKKLNFVEILLSYYLENGKYTDALVLANYIDECFKNYIQENNLDSLRRCFNSRHY